MSKRKKQPVRNDDGTSALNASHAADENIDHQPAPRRSPRSTPRPFRRQLPFLVISSALLVAWILFLAAMAFGS